MKTYTTQELTNYINDKVNLLPNEYYTIWSGPHGLAYTRGSMEYRDEDHKLVLIIFTMDEPPQNKEDIKSMVQHFKRA